LEARRPAEGDYVLPRIPAPAFTSGVLKSLTLKGYRGFKDFSVEELSRVTLLVGKNNAGKTSVLEAAEMIARGGSPAGLVRSLTRRAEFTQEIDRLTRDPELDVCHLFHGHNIDFGTKFSIIGTESDNQKIGLSCEIVPEFPHEEQGPVPLDESDAGNPMDFLDLLDLQTLARRTLRLENQSNGRRSEIRLSPAGGLSSRWTTRAIASDDPAPRPVISIPTEGLDPRSLGKFWNSLVLEPAEERVVDALRIIEPDIERLAFVAEDDRPFRPSHGFKVKLGEYTLPVPFGSLGDGMKRLLALAIAVNRAAGGVLLIDEIDTGLHYSAMIEMWRMVIKTARALDVQVIATSHSGDCLKSLAWLQEDDPELASDLSLHRIEKCSIRSTAYSAGEIGIAVRQHMEIRG
jgi:hypothetical protein